MSFCVFFFLFLIRVPYFYFELPRFVDSIRKILAQEARTLSAFAKKSKQVKNLEKKGI